MMVRWNGGKKDILHIVLGDEEGGKLRKYEIRRIRKQNEK